MLSLMLTPESFAHNDRALFSVKGHHFYRILLDLPQKGSVSELWLVPVPLWERKLAFEPPLFKSRKLLRVSILLWNVNWLLREALCTEKVLLVRVSLWNAAWVSKKLLLGGNLPLKSILCEILRGL